MLHDDFSYFGLQFGCWNLQHYTLTLVVIFTLWLANGLDERLALTLDELSDNQSLRLSKKQCALLIQALNRFSLRWEIRTSVLFGLFMCTAYIIRSGEYMVASSLNVFSDNELVHKFEHLYNAFAVQFSGVIIAIVCGANLARVAIYGNFARRIGSSKLPIRVRIGHFDGANGLAPLGDFYLYQALLVFLPLLWLATWIVLTPYYYHSDCFEAVDRSDASFQSQVQFLIQWLVLATFAFLGFFKPVISMRRLLKEHRDVISGDRITIINEKIAVLENSNHQIDDAQGENIFELAKERWEIRNMNIWPMSADTKSKYFSMELIGTFLPIFTGPISLLTSNDLSLSDVFTTDFWVSITAALLPFI